MVAGFSALGVTTRRFLPGHRVETVANSKDAYFAWRDARVRGRVLVVFDRWLSVEETSEASVLTAIGDPPAENEIVTSNNFLTAAISAGQIRRVYQVIDDPTWQQASSDLARDPNATKDGPRYLMMIGGVPVVFTLASDLPDLGEKALVFVNREQAGGYAPAALDSWINDSAKSDLVIIHE